LDHHGVLSAELKRRVSLLAHYLDMSWPEDEDAWLKLVIAICSRWNVPGFQLTATGSGAKKKWPIWKNLELAFDVHSLVAENKRFSEYGACQYIAQHPEKYENRYPDQTATLHRQFLRAKKEHRQFLRAKKELARSGSESFDPALVAEVDAELDFFATRRRMLEKMATLQSRGLNMRRKVDD